MHSVSSRGETATNDTSLFLVATGLVLCRLYHVCCSLCRGQILGRLSCPVLVGCLRCADVLAGRLGSGAETTDHATVQKPSWKL